MYSLDVIKNTKIEKDSLGIHYPGEKRKFTCRFYMRNISNICVTEHLKESEILLGGKVKDDGIGSQERFHRGRVIWTVYEKEW